MDRRRLRGSRPWAGGGAVAALALLSTLLVSGAPVAAEPGTHPAGLSVGITASTTSGSAPLVVAFTSTVSGDATPGGVQYNWSFGDGGFLNGTGGQYSTPLHTYQHPGSYLADLNVSEGGSSANASLRIVVTPAPLTVKIHASATSGGAPLTVDFEGILSGGSETYSSVLWEFGNGAQGSGLALNYTYTTAGSFLATLTVVDSAGDTASAYLWINVTAPQSSSGGWVATLTSALPWIVAVVAVILAVVAWWDRPGRREEETERVEAPPERPPDSPPPVERPRESESPGPSVSSTVPLDRPGPPLPPETPTPASLDARSVPDAIPAPVAPSSDAVVSGSSEASVRPSEPSPASEPKPTPETPSAPLPAPAAVPEETLRLSMRVVLHLASQGSLAPHEVSPAGRTQAGMAEALGARQNSLATILKRLEVAGVLASDVRHVRGAERRMKVYRLTPRGEELARDLRSRSAAKRRDLPE